MLAMCVGMYVTPPKSGKMWQNVAKVAKSGRNCQNLAKVAKNGKSGKKWHKWQKWPNLAYVCPFLDSPRLSWP